MQITKSLQYGVKHFPTIYDEPELCPLCNHAIQPLTLDISNFKDNRDSWYVACLFLCKHCYQVFLAFYRAHIVGGKESHFNCELLYIGPKRFTEETFEASLTSLSPSFVRIYNQALAAETAGLDEIAGIGYRKSLEFLIKDYLIHCTDDEAEIEKIKAMQLANCIANKVDNSRLKTVASRAVWLGNDETHYVRRFEDKDITDMKNFIKATVYWISMELTTEAALTIESRGQ